MTAPLLCLALLAADPAGDPTTGPLTGAAAERAAEAALERLLDAPPPAGVAVTGDTFVAAARSLGESVGVPVVVSADAAGDAATAGPPFVPPTDAVRAAPTLRAAFGALLAARGGEPLALENRAGLLRVVPAAVATEHVFARVYDVRGLPAALGMGDDELLGEVVERVAGPGAGAAPEAFDPPLIAALKTGVGPAPGVPAWDSDGGPAAVAPLAGRLIVRHSAAGHAALARLLDDLRATASGSTPKSDPAPPGAE